MIDLDNVFKKLYVNHMFFLLPSVEPNWKKQIQQLHSLWEMTGNLIKKGEFIINFSRECRDLKLNNEQYDIVQAFDNANHEWKKELMLTVADRIIKFNDDNVPLNEQVVTIKNGCIHVMKSQEYNSQL